MHVSADLIFKGGPVMFLLLAMSIYVVAVMIFKAYQFATSHVLEQDDLEPVLLDISNKQFDRASGTLSTVQGPVAEVARAALAALQNRELTKETRAHEVQRVGNAQVKILESHLRGLDLAANVGPLLGLFGTVLGMIAAFSKLQQQGVRIDPSQLAGGIWEALITTAGGLFVAIPALAAYYIIDGVIEKIRARMKDVSVRILSVDDALNAEAKRLEIAERKAKEAEMARLEDEKKKAEHAKPPVEKVETKPAVKSAAAINPAPAKPVAPPAMAVKPVDVAPASPLKTAAMIPAGVTEQSSLKLAKPKA